MAYEDNVEQKQELERERITNRRLDMDKRLTAMSRGNTDGDDAHWEIGKSYLIRTVTMIYTGRLVKVVSKELVIDTAAWIPETERWQQAVESGQFKEVEPYPTSAQVILGRGAILDAVKVDWPLPQTQK